MTRPAPAVEDAIVIPPPRPVWRRIAAAAMAAFLSLASAAIGAFALIGFLMVYTLLWRQEAPSGGFLSARATAAVFVVALGVLDATRAVIREMRK
jgi:hypothetical protein